MSRSILSGYAEIVVFDNVQWLYVLGSESGVLFCATARYHSHYA